MSHPLPPRNLGWDGCPLVLVQKTLHQGNQSVTASFSGTEWRSLNRKYVYLAQKTVLKGRKIRVYRRVRRTAKSSN